MSNRLFLLSCDPVEWLYKFAMPCQPSMMQFLPQKGQTGQTGTGDRWQVTSWNGMALHCIDQSYGISHDILYNQTFITKYHFGNQSEPCKQHKYLAVPFVCNTPCMLINYTLNGNLDHYCLASRYTKCLSFLLRKFTVTKQPADHETFKTYKPRKCSDWSFTLGVLQTGGTALVKWDMSITSAVNNHCCLQSKWA